MRVTRTVVLAGAAALLVAGAAVAATGNLHNMEVNLPDGSVAHIQYVGDVAPKVEIKPLEARAEALADPFAAFGRIHAMMELRHRQMMQQIAQMQRLAAEAGTSAAPGQVVVSGNLPAGTTVRYSFFSASNGQGCTRTVQWQSDGSGNAPKVTRTSSGDCDAVRRGETVVPVSEPAPAPKPAPAKPRVDPRSI